MHPRPHNQPSSPAPALLAVPAFTFPIADFGGTAPVGVQRSEEWRINAGDIEEGGDILDIQEKRAATITCSSRTNKPKTKFKAATTTAEAQAKAGGFATNTKSGYPHQYQNNDKLKWRIELCDASPEGTDIKLLEYPIYWTGVKKKAWTKDKKNYNQGCDWKTPIRVASSETNGTGAGAT
ncbi:uncharacterized protein BO95DRAFT_458651 [Aspergillus brunneoviolaceus CBS 621.78]|uniref:Uncharacterized protein n=1 Tax=Aspergillus brunneoviolaceus CBS 621.78 TaxID=1450534 RepID=A0ACD1GPK8_9EURO|nr:hypothetical protein BO95DRAFT_458651 [Aspergillus brunneoviolaceus CBS 621.78]RAH51300.1 hypothetical protein BO95DRAFT_458651 [Aspergillus brunneoviolaceus CBS 621.78]